MRFAGSGGSNGGIRVGPLSLLMQIMGTAQLEY